MLPKVFIFSDESGSWHDENDVYVRAWIGIFGSEQTKLENKISEMQAFTGATEIKWKTVAGNKHFFDYFAGLDYRIFITITAPKDIRWSEKYKITKNFNKILENIDFAGIDEITREEIKRKIWNDIKYILFLRYFEKIHIENATKRIEEIIKPINYDLVYEIDPPQMSKADWGKMLKLVSDKELKFPKSEKSCGVQFADIVAGCFRSLLLKDERYEEAKEFYKSVKEKMISNRNTKYVNPNIIFYEESSESMKDKIKEIYKL